MRSVLPPIRQSRTTSRPESAVICRDVSPFLYFYLNTANSGAQSSLSEDSWIVSGDSILARGSEFCEALKRSNSPENDC